MTCGWQERLHGAIRERNSGLQFSGICIDDGELNGEDVFESNLLFREVDDRCFSCGKHMAGQVGGRFVPQCDNALQFSRSLGCDGDRQFLGVFPIQRGQ